MMLSAREMSLMDSRQNNLPPEDRRFCDTAVFLRKHGYVDKGFGVWYKDGNKVTLTPDFQLFLDSVYTKGVMDGLKDSVSDDMRDFSADNAGDGCVYVMSNFSLPHLVKIGASARPEQRVYAANSNTFSPGYFFESFSIAHPNYRQIETLVKRKMKLLRLNKEFFVCTAEFAEVVIRKVIHDLKNGVPLDDIATLFTYPGECF